METIYDIYVVRSSGIPIFAGCTGTDYCMMNMDQHELQSGFLAAMYSFGKESFKGSNLKTIVFDDIIVSMKSDSEKGIIVVFIHPSEVSAEVLDSKITKAMDVFLTKYYPKLEANIIDTVLFEEFKEELRNLEIIPSLMSTMGMQNEIELYQKNKPSLFRWIKGKLFN